jgi:hypothetical protein
MHPVRPLAVVFHNQLVEWQVVFNIVKPPLTFLDVAVYAQVGSLSFHVLAIADPSHGLVEGLTPEATAYLDGFVHRYTQGFQDVCTQIHQIDHLLHVWLVVNTKTLCRF